VKQLASYLRDHPAGATAAIEFLEQLTESQQDSALRKLFQELQGENRVG
jgi:hypothetical protein